VLELFGIVLLKISLPKKNSSRLPKKRIAKSRLLPFPCVPDRPSKILLVQVGTLLSFSHPLLACPFYLFNDAPGRGFSLGAKRGKMWILAYYHRFPNFIFSAQSEPTHSHTQRESFQKSFA